MAAGICSTLLLNLFPLPVRKDPISITLSNATSRSGSSKANHLENHVEQRFDPRLLAR